MARRIIWSSDAKFDLNNILKYWQNRNKSSVYSKKLRKLIRDSLKIITIYSQSGKISDFEEVRIKIVKDYHVLYEQDSNDNINILRVWDTRQDPEKLKI